MVEAKASGTNNNCLLGPVPFSGNGQTVTVSPTVVQKGGSAGTDALYVYVIPDWMLTRSADAYGNVLSTGVVSASFNVDATSVYQNGGSCTLTGTQYVYFFDALPPGDERSTEQSRGCHDGSDSLLADGGPVKT